MESWSNLKAWKKGAILGGIWGLVSIIPYSWIVRGMPAWKSTIYTLLGFPTVLAIKAGWHFQAVFLGAPIFGALIGYIYEKLRGLK